LRSERAAWWIVVGSILIASAIFNTVINLNSTPNFWSGLTIFEILLFGCTGLGLVVYGVTVYRRVSRAETR
jgi:uncharacterized membrane protein YhaH (DUF805 family)